MTRLTLVCESPLTTVNASYSRFTVMYVEAMDRIVAGRSRKKSLGPVLAL